MNYFIANYRHDNEGGQKTRSLNGFFGTKYRRDQQMFAYEEALGLGEQFSVTDSLMLEE